MSAASNELAERIRDRLAGDPRVTEKKAFGGIMFLLNGNMIGAANRDGRMLLRVGKDDYAAMLEREGAGPMDHGGREMRGFIWVEAYAIEEENDLDTWLDIARKYAMELPPK